MEIMKATNSVHGIARAMIEFAATLIDNDAIVSATFRVDGVFLEIKHLVHDKDERAVQFEVATERGGKRNPTRHVTFYMKDKAETEAEAVKCAKGILADWRNLHIYPDFGTKV